MGDSRGLASFAPVIASGSRPTVTRVPGGYAHLPAAVAPAANLMILHGAPPTGVIAQLLNDDGDSFPVLFRCGRDVAMLFVAHHHLLEVLAMLLRNVPSRGLRVFGSLDQCSSLSRYLRRAGATRAGRSLGLSVVSHFLAPTLQDGE